MGEKKKSNWFDHLFKRTINVAPCSQRRIRSCFKAAKAWDVAWKLAIASSFNSFFWFPVVGKKKEKKSCSGGTVDSHFNYKGCESTREWWDVFPFTPSDCRHTPSKLAESAEQLCFSCLICFNVRTKTWARFLPLKNQVKACTFQKKRNRKKSSSHLVFLCPSQHQNSPTHVLPFFPPDSTDLSLKCEDSKALSPQTCDFFFFFSKDL